jgi:hypothetical protein
MAAAKDPITGTPVLKEAATAKVRRLIEALGDRAA